MSPVQQTKIKHVFAEAAELDPSDRGSYLERACGDDVELRHEVDRLLRAFEETQDLLGSCSVADFLLGRVHPEHTLAVGDCVGRFVITRLIGKGGFGEVYEAADPQLSGRVALKTMRPESLSRTDYAARFRREIQLARKVTHPNVCRIYDVGRQEVRQNEIVYVTMELLAGQTLAERLKGGPLRPAEALPIIRQIGKGLAALHEAGVIHRDLKPANVVLVSSDSGQRTVITDFGLAHQLEAETGLDSVTVAGEVLGTPAYMAPEQLSGKKVGTEADIYSLGIVMYEILCGCRPYDAQQFVESATQKLSRPATPPSRHVKLDPRWDALILRCLECDIAKRPRSVTEVLALLDHFDEKPGWKRYVGAGSPLVPRHRLSTSLLYAGLAATVAAAVPMQFSAVRTPVLRRLCQQWPGYSAFCELPADKDMAVLPFVVKGSTADDRALASGVARYIRESFERLAPQPENLCVHLRTDKLADGVRLAVEGEVEAAADSVAIRFAVREAGAAHGRPQPLTLRRTEVRFARANARLLHSEALLRLSRALGVHYPEREWRGWSQAGPSRSESFLAHLKGLGYLEQARYQEAAQAFTDAIDPTKDFAFAPAHVGLGDAYRLLRNKTGDDAWAIRARQAYQRAVPLDRDFGFAGAEKRWGELEAGLRDTNAAVAHMNGALRLWPYDHLLVKALALAYESAGQPDQAEKVLREATERTPQCWLAHNALADFYSRHARIRDAEKVLLEVVRLAPENSNAYHNLALNYRRLGRLDDAIEMGARSIALQPHPLTYSALGRAYLYRGCPSDALINLRKAVDLDRDYFGVWANLAEGLYATEPRSEAAAAVLKRTVELSGEVLEKAPANVYARAQHAVNLARLGQARAAIQEAERAVAQSPRSHNILVLAAETFEVVGFRERALAQLERAVRTGLSLHEAEAPPGLARLRRDPAYSSMLQRLQVNPGADPGGLTPSPRRPCPQSQVPGVGLGGK